jgi:hypothetical protein
MKTHPRIVSMLSAILALTTLWIVVAVAALALDWRAPYPLPYATDRPEPAAGYPVLIREFDYLPRTLGPWGDSRWRTLNTGAFVAAVPPAYDPVPDVLRWVGCVNTYNTARLRGMSNRDPAGTHAPDPFGPCGPQPGTERVLDAVAGIDAPQPHDDAMPPPPWPAANWGAAR